LLLHFNSFKIKCFNCASREKNHFYSLRELSALITEDHGIIGFNLATRPVFLGV